MVRLRIAEKEARLKKMAAAKEYKKPINGISNVKEGKYYLVRLEMEIEKLKSKIDESERDNRLCQLPEEGKKISLKKISHSSRSVLAIASLK